MSCTAVDVLGLSDLNLSIVMKCSWSEGYDWFMVLNAALRSWKIRTSREGSSEDEDEVTGDIDQGGFYDI